MYIFKSLNLPPITEQSVTLPSLWCILIDPAIRPLAVVTKPRSQGGVSNKQHTSLTATSKFP